MSTSLHTEPLGHVPALDGIRALAVVAVLVFHGDVTGAGGGFLGVSVFFTLSGFLITSLLLREWAAGTGASTAAGIDLRRFWSRRFRRLLPASWLTVGLVLLLGWAGAWDTEQLRALRGDVPWSLAELVNWHFIIEGTSYGAAQSSPSPLEHFWSLAIEQQFYVLLPALLMLLLARGDGPPRRRLRTAAVVLAALAVASAVANGLLAGGSVDRAYFGTDTRAAELLVGALLAFAMLSKVRLEDRWRRVAVAGGALAIAVLVVLFHTAALTSRWLYPWGLLLTAGCTAALVVGAVQRGPLASALALRPMVLLGRISYGVYLLHWPVFLWLDEARTGLDGAALFAVRVVVSLAAATAMYHLVEMPIRTGRRIGTTTARVAVPCAAVVLLAGSFALTRDLPPPPDFLQPRDPGEVQIREVPTTTTTTTTTTPPPPTTAGAAPTTTPTTAPPPPPRRPQRVLLVGDSVAASLEDALGDALVERGISFATAATPGCGLLTGDPADAQGTPLEFTSACNGAIPEVQSGAVSDVGPDLVVALSTWEAGDRVVDGTWYQVGTPAGTDMMRRLYGETIQRLSARGATVAFLTIPDFVDSRTRPADTETNRRLRYVNDLLVDIGATYLGPVTTMRLDRIVCPATPCPTQVEGVTLRPGDGAHLDDAAGARCAAQRLADQIAAMALHDPG